MKIHDVKILSDENISQKVVTFLKQQSIDVLDVKEQMWHGKEDEDLLEIAFLQKRFVLTHDSDFGTLAIHRGKRCFGIIYLRLKSLHPQNVIKACGRLFNLDLSISPGTILIVEENRIRVRPST